jgi:ABC-type Zn uptake system ZnuABC Zn-binding protein ZnuA
MKAFTLWPALAALVAASGIPGQERTTDSGAQASVKVVTTLPVYASIAREIGGDLVEALAMTGSNEDAHFVRPKPSFALELRRADLFVTTGLDLELWVPPLIDKAGNPDVSEGGRGYVTAYTGVRLLEVPATADRSAGDVHIYGNPHLTTDPLRSIQVARNIAAGLRAVAPESAGEFDQGLARFTDDIHRRLFGDRLVELVGGEALSDMAMGGILYTFLETNELDGRMLIEELGGWLAAAEPFRGQEMICYHKHWAYFEQRFDVTCAEFVEAKPGIPPTPRHVAQLIDMMNSRGMRVLFAASHFDPSKVESVARRGGATPVVVPLYPGSGPGDYFALVDLWVSSLADAFRPLDR